MVYAILPIIYDDVLHFRATSRPERPMAAVLSVHWVGIIASQIVGCVIMSLQLRCWVILYFDDKFISWGSSTMAITISL